MRRLTTWLAGPIVALAATHVCASPILPQTGDYAAEPSLAALAKTRSHFAAAQALSGLNVAQSMRVRGVPDGLEFMAGWNWHEGAVAFTEKPDGTLIPGEAWTLGARNGRHWSMPVVDGPDRVRLQAPTGKAPVLYRHVGNLERMVADTLLKGHYVDELGRPYEFGDTWQARFPEGPVAFQVNLDIVAAGFDAIRVCAKPADRPEADSDGCDETTKSIAFRWVGDRLLLAPVKDDTDGATLGTADFTHPIARLRRTP